MAKDKIDLKTLTVEELHNKVAEDRALIEKLHFSHAVSQIENPMSIRTTRRQIARMMTEINNRTNHQD
jgi:large subunit ribosomal protein L29